MSNTDVSNKIDVAFTTSAGFSNFLTELHCSVAVSTYQTGNLFLFGPAKDDTLAICPIKLPRPMGMYYQNGSLWVGGQSFITRFNNILPKNVQHDGKDRIFLPQVRWTTGDIDCHDIVCESDGRLVFVNSLYSCLSAVSESCSFSVTWRPPVVTEMAPEDRCHLNGLALRDGKARYASAFSVHNEKQGWRKKREQQGVIWDITNNSLVAEGLTMPHSPRWYRDTLWCLDSGSGAFGKIDFKLKRFVPLLSLPGYLRGLSFMGDLVCIGSSIPRANSEIHNPKLEKVLAEKGSTQKCGIFFVHIPTLKLVHFVQISEGVQEIYDVALITGSLKPWAYAPDAEELSHLLNIG